MQYKINKLQKYNDFFKKPPLKPIAFLELYAIIIKQLMRNKKQNERNETPTENEKNLKFFDRYMRAQIFRK